MRTNYVVIPVVNCWAYTKKCIESIHSKEPFKIIIVDNGSVDDTLKAPVLLDRNADLLMSIRNDQNEGVSYAWNQGIKEAMKDNNCGYIYVLNNDIELREDAFDNLITCADQGHLGSSNYMLVSSMPFVGPYEELDKAPVTYSESEGGCYSAFMIAPGTIRDIGWFDEGFYPAYYEDNDYDYRIKMSGKVSKKVTSSQFFNHQSRTIAENPDVKNMVDKNMMKCKSYYMDKWGGQPHFETFRFPFDKASLPLTKVKQDE